jgi:hypothetical protein
MRQYDLQTLLVMAMALTKKMLALRNGLAYSSIASAMNSYKAFTIT